MRVFPASSLGSRRILIFGINYWPEQLGIAPYTTGLAEHLARQGHDVTVVTGFPHYPQWQLDPTHRYRIAAEETINGVRVIRRRHHVPERPSAARRGLYELTFGVNGLGSLIRGTPDLILGVSPSVSGGLLARSASLRWGVPYGVWFQDLSGRAASQSGIEGGNLVARLVDSLEARAARGAAAVGVISDGFNATLEGMGVDGHRIRKIRNWSHIQRPTLAKADARLRFGLPANRFICLHAGNMGQKQGLENIIDTAGLAASDPDSPLFVLQGDGNTRADLERRSAGLPNVRFLPPQPDIDFPNALAAADVLLVNQKPTITDMCLPGKLTSYFAADRPVIAAVNEASETAIELRRADAGSIVPAGEPAALLAAIESIRRDPGFGSRLATNGRCFVESELSPAAAFANLDSFIESIARGRISATMVETAQLPGAAD